MGTRETRDLPARLEGLRRRFERWRQTRKVRSRIPEPLWASAVKVAGTYGIHRTAKALRVDYYALKKPVEEHGPPLVLKSDNGSAFIAHLTQEAMLRAVVAQLFSPPKPPEYNGPLERSNGVLKTYTHQHALQEGHPFGAGEKAAR